MTWTVQCLKEDKKVALTKTVPAAGILALPWTWAMTSPLLDEAAPQLNPHVTEMNSSRTVWLLVWPSISWDQSGPLSEQGHKYTEAQNVGYQGKRLKQSLEVCFLFLAFVFAILETFFIACPCFFSTCYILKTLLRQDGVQRIRFFFLNNLRTLESRLPTLCNGVSFFMAHINGIVVDPVAKTNGKGELHPSSTADSTALRHSPAGSRERHPSLCAGTADIPKPCSPNTVQGTVTALSFSVRKNKAEVRFFK